MRCCLLNAVLFDLVNHCLSASRVISDHEVVPLPLPNNYVWRIVTPSNSVVCLSRSIRRVRQWGARSLTCSAISSLVEVIRPRLLSRA